MIRFALIAVAFAGSPAIAQDHNIIPLSALPTSEASDDIIVSALAIPREKLPTQVHWNYATMLQTRVDYQQAGMFMRCAANLATPELLRQVVDGDANAASTRFAQSFLIRTNQGCFPPTRGLYSTFLPRPVTDLDRGQFAQDRSALIETIFKTYAPGATLTREETARADVQLRFSAREVPRNRLRLSDERDAFLISSCLVRNEPVLATRIVQASSGTMLERGLVQSIVVNGRACVGQVKSLTIDPVSLRYYIVDSFYRWVVAARGVDSLIPAAAKG